MKDLLAYANELDGKISEETSKIKYDGGLIEDILEDSDNLEFYERRAYLEMD